MTETPIPVEFDPRTLETVGVRDYNSNHISGQFTTAHPHFDFSKNETINYMTHISRKSSYNIYKISSGRKQQLELITSVKVNEPSYMHSFGLTEHYMILVEFPLVINPFDILISGKPFAENLLWKPENGTKFTIVSRTNEKVVGSYQSEPFFAFHHVNSFETENNGIVVDIVAYPDSTIVRSRWILLKAQRFSPCIFHTVSVMWSDTVGHIADLMGMIFNDGSYSGLSKYLISYAATHNLLEV